MLLEASLVPVHVVLIEVLSPKAIGDSKHHTGTVQNSHKLVLISIFLEINILFFLLCCKLVIGHCYYILYLRTHTQNSYERKSIRNFKRKCTFSPVAPVRPDGPCVSK